MSYRLGVDVGGTFTDLILVNEQTGDFFSAKVPSTPHDSSVGVLNGVERVCKNARIDPNEITHVMHGTTVATNTILTHTGAKVGLVTTKGYRQVLQIARSFVPGGLGGWVIYNKPLPLAPLALTIEAEERVGARGEVVRKLNKTKLAKDLRALGAKKIEALTVSLINSFANPCPRTGDCEDRGQAASRNPGLAFFRSGSRNAGIRANRHDGRKFLRGAQGVEIHP